MAKMCGRLKCDSFFISYKSLLKGPICFSPPDIPFEGSLNISSPIHGVEQSDTCQVDAGELSLMCPSFLNIYVRSATYGRKALEKIMCNGEKDPAPFKDCLDTNVLTKVREACHGKFRCNVSVTGNLADLSATCNSNKKELKTNHTCSKFL